MSGEPLMVVTADQNRTDKKATTTPATVIKAPTRSNATPQLAGASPRVPGRGWRPITTSLVPTGRPQDLLLMHHSLQTPASRWKQLRRRLGRGRPITAQTAVNPLKEIEQRRGQAWKAHDSLDVLDLTEHADTIVIAGSSASLYAGSVPFLQLAIWAPSAVRSNPQQGWYSTAIHPLGGLVRHRTGKGLCLIHTDPWIAANASGSN